jgi:hypothetical protein
MMKMRTSMVLVTVPMKEDAEDSLLLVLVVFHRAEESEGTLPDPGILGQF